MAPCGDLGLACCAGTTVCAVGLACQYAVCVALPPPAGEQTCLSGETGCNGACVNVETDSNNCGACGTMCSRAQTCSSGSCACPVLGETLCGDACVNEKVDSNNCGGCEKACPALAPICESGRCMCPAADTVCSGACVNEETDAHNCGGCGVECGGTCSLGRCLITLASGESARGVAVGVTTVYWTAAVTVMGIPVNGGPSITVASGQSGPLSVAVDTSSVYWTNGGEVPGTGTVMKAGLLGGHAPITLASGQNGPQSVVVDGTSVYWTNEGTAANSYADGTVMSVPLNGGTPMTLASNQNGPQGLAVDAISVYWADEGTAAYQYSDGTVMSVPITGSPTPTTLASGQADPYGVATDATSVYWTNALGGTVMKAPLGGVPDGGTATTLAGGVPDGGASEAGVVASGPDYPLTLALDTANVYWTNYDLAFGTVMKVALDGGTPVTIAAVQDGPFGIAVGAKSVYWTDLTSGALMEATPK